MRYKEISKKSPLVLASASPRRKEILDTVGLPYRAIAGSVHESLGFAGPEEATCRLAQKKAEDVKPQTREAWVLGADTIVAIDGDMLGKPGNGHEAGDMLFRLSGKEHTVVTGFCILDPSGRDAHIEAVTTRVRFKKLSRLEIQGYIETGEPFGKAGAYAIQKIGAFMVEEISGSYTNVVGLPVCALVKALISTGAVACFPFP